MKGYTTLFLIFAILSCGKTRSSVARIDESTATIENIEVNEIILTETTLGKLALEKLNERNIVKEIKATYPDFKIIKSVGQQDGPDYNFYQVKHSGKELFVIAMDSYDTTLVSDLWTDNLVVKDQYGISAGQRIEVALENRPGLNFHSDLHYNIYATEKNSRIEYRLTGDFKSLNDSSLVKDNYSVEKWQIEGMTVEYVIWRK